ncbi:MAG: hypothetical protein HZB61_10610 [Nitrospirae bacterium]|nr:hypothetical protein [Nitrospirota bacterium]
MNDLKDEVQNSALLKVIKDSLEDARDTAQKLAQVFKDNVLQLRLEQTESVLNQLTRSIEDLQNVMDFTEKLREAMQFFKDFGLPADPITNQGAGINLFKEMNNAIETKDWIMLSDLIEYELAPLLIKEDEWFGSLEEKLKAY